ncbi:MAG: amidohydrolase family protein, partial [Chloroflexota bacterium]
MLAITGARVLTITKGEIDGGTILIDNGRIVGVGSGLAVPADAQMIDARGKIVMPGLIDAHSHVGIGEEGLGWAGMDVNEMTDPATPHLRAIDAINPEDQGFKDALSGGVTSVMVAPGSANIIGGEVALLKCYGRTIADMVVREPVGLKAALGENPKRVYGDQKKTPSTRMASAAVLREQIVRAQNYLDKIAHRDEDKPFE